MKETLDMKICCVSFIVVLFTISSYNSNAANNYLYLSVADTTDTADTTVHKSLNLNEVVVTPEMMRQYDSHTTYRISGKDMARYSNFGQALNVVPFLTVSSSGDLTYKGNPNVGMPPLLV